MPVYATLLFAGRLILYIGGYMSKPTHIKDITLEDILYWIVINSDNVEAIDKINKTTFPFTTSYKEWQQNND